MVKVISMLQWNKAVERNINKAAQRAVVGIGIPKDSRYPNGITVESVAFAQEFGNGNVPPRPFVRNAIVEKKDEWKEKAVRKLGKVANGKTNGSSKTALKALGDEVKADIVKSIETLVDPALKPVTVEVKKAKGRRHPEKPLIDSGLLKSSFKVEVSDD